MEELGLLGLVYILPSHTRPIQFAPLLSQGASMWSLFKGEMYFLDSHFISFLYWMVMISLLFLGCKTGARCSELENGPPLKENWRMVGCLPRKRSEVSCVSLSFQEYVWEASHYLVQLVFNSLKEMFSGTREIQVNHLPSCCLVPAIIA